MSLSLGTYRTSINTASLTDGDSIAAYLTGAAGDLITSTTIGGKVYADSKAPSDFLDGATYTAGTDYLAAAGAVDESGTWKPLNINAAGELLVNAAVTFTAEHNEDDVAGNGFSGIATLLVRQDTLATSTSADGDFGAFKSNANGELYTFDTTTHTTLSSILSEIQSVTYAEDSGHVSGDPGVFSLAVRNDANAVLTSADLDYSPFAVDSAGRMKAVFGGQYAEDSASANADTGLFALAVRRDTTGTQTSATGDYSEIQTWSNGELKVVDIANSTILQQQKAVTSTATTLPTTALANRKTLMVQNSSDRSIWIGSATVTSSGATTGIELPKNSFMELEVGPAVTVYGITASGSANANLLEMS